MKLSIEEISLPDVPITTMHIEAERCIVTICSDRIFKISDNKWLGKTQITVSDWEYLRVEKYVSQAPFTKGQTFQIDWTEQTETFEFIHEINCSDKEILALSGFSKESGAWLTYTFNNFRYDIKVNEINNNDTADIY